MNALPPRGKEQNVRKIGQTPPKYTPAVFEEVRKYLIFTKNMIRWFSIQ